MDRSERAGACGRLGGRCAVVLGALALFGLGACSGANTRGEDAVDPSPAEDPAEAGAPDATAEVDPFATRIEPGPATKRSRREHPAGEAWVFDAGDAPRKVAIDQAEARGYTVVDLSDEWVPFIFSDKTPGVDDASTNEYARLYVDLANDRKDDDGRALEDWQHNYLELYGIPPTLSVIGRDWDFAEGELARCLEQASYDPSAFEGFTGSIGYKKGRGKKHVSKARWAKATLDKEMKKAGIPAGDYAAAAEHEATARHHGSWRELQQPVDIVANAQIRLRCERMFNSRDGHGKFTPGEYEAATHHALANFERKHNLMGWGHFKTDNVAQLGKDPPIAVYERLERTIRERTLSSAGILEDGSARDWKPDFRYRDASGEERGLRDLGTEFTDAVLTSLGLEDPATAHARLDELRELNGGSFEHFLVALKLPELPPYYAENMDFETVIDRGDVWYDFPWSDDGSQAAQPRKRYPKLTLYVNYEGQKIPLVHWRTTIGHWRSELHDGKEYYAYKNSDVGPRVWKTIMAAPVWIPPDYTPTRALVKLQRGDDGKLHSRVNYDETGPGYKSAYGLVAAYHIKQVERRDGTVAELDNQIRTHGSVDYMSILRRYSHGCHRLYNMNAVRLFSFVLTHRDYEREGQTKIGYRRAFEENGKSFRMALDTRGYKYELAEPIPVLVTEGTVRGRRQSPYTELMRKPGVDYDDPTLAEEITEGVIDWASGGM